MKIKQTIHIILLCFTIIPLFVFGVFMIFENDRNVESIMNENLAVSSGAKIMDIENFCDGRKDDLDTISGWSLTLCAVDESLGGGSSLTENEKKYLDDMLVSRCEINDFSESFSIIDRDFRVVASSHTYTKGKESKLINANPGFLTGDFVISDIVDINDSGSTDRVVTAIEGIYSEGELQGYAVEEINLTFFDQIRTETNLWEEGTLYLLDGNNSMITAGDSREKSRQQFVLSEKERKNYTDAWNEIDFEAEPVGEIKYEAGGNTYLTYYSDIDYTNWRILVSVNLSRYQEKKAAYILLIVIIIVAVSALFFVLNYFISAKLTKPIQNIVSILKNVQKKQDYTLRVDNNKKDEIGSLAGEVNILLGYIEQENHKEQERQRCLKKRAERDSLTGVYNKKAVEDRLRDMIHDMEVQGGQAAIAVVDIDDFKDFNTLYGHQGGDRVLRYLASCLKQIDGGIVGRIGGDEFLIGLRDVSDTDRLEGTIEQLRSKINEGIYDEISNERLTITCCIGIAVGVRGRLNYTELFQKADAAMYEAKNSGKNTYIITS